MKLVTSAQMREIEKITIEEYKIPSLILMENAAVSFCEILRKNVNLQDKKIGIYCGKGNNGGDGFAIGRHLANDGHDVEILTVFAEDECARGDAKINADAAKAMGISVIPFQKAKRYDVIIDAIFGTGFSGEVRGTAAEAIDDINKSGAHVAACDMPSGADASCAKVGGHVVKADMTVTFCAAKYGQFFYPAKTYTGKLFLAPISVPKKYLDSFDSKRYSIDEDVMKVLLPRCETAHKGTCGRAFAIAGSPGMSGACIMASGAALKTGAGLVTAATDSETAKLVTLKYPEIMTCIYDKNKTENIFLNAKKSDAILIGCGMGISDENAAITEKLIRESNVPLIIDADGITNIAKNIEVLKEKKSPIILTPHVGEFSRMTGMSAAEIEDTRYECAANFAKEYGVILLLKGANTVCADEKGTVYVSPKANPGLATAGSGDVLAGIITGLAAQSIPPYDAALAGIYIHSVTGEAAAEEYGVRAMTATDLINNISKVIKRTGE